MKLTKLQVHQTVSEELNNRILRIEKALKGHKEGLLSESNSSAGDKHNTSRAMMHLEEEKLRNQLSQFSKLNKVLHGINSTSEHKQITLGSLVNTDKGWLYISVPLFSLTSLMQSSFNRIYPRQLGGPHTHLYTKESLEYIAKKNNFKIIGEWWFGTDFLDFYRFLESLHNFYVHFCILKRTGFCPHFFARDLLQGVFSELKRDSEFKLQVLDEIQLQWKATCFLQDLLL